MSKTPHPIRHWAGTQSDLVWRGTEAVSAMGMRSNMGSIIARLEGGGGITRLGPDLVEDPDAALAVLRASSSLVAAARASIIDHGLARVEVKTRMVLIAVYWGPPDPTLEAWELLANAVVYSDEARRRYIRSESERPFLDWLRSLSLRRVGPIEKGKRKPARATEVEISSVLAIKNDVTKMLGQCLAEFARHRPRAR